MSRQLAVCPAPVGTEPFLFGATLPQPLPFDIHPQPSPVMGLIAETLGLRCQVLGLVGWSATLVDVDGYPFPERFVVRDHDRVCYLETFSQTTVFFH